MPYVPRRAAVVLLPVALCWAVVGLWRGSAATTHGTLVRQVATTASPVPAKETDAGATKWTADWSSTAVGDATARERASAHLSSAGTEAEVPFPGRAAREAPSFSQLADTWSAARADDEWTNNMTTYLDALLDTVDAGLDRPFVVECRETACRAEFDGALIPRLVHVNRSLNGMERRFQYEHVRADGGSTLVAYFERNAL